MNLLHAGAFLMASLSIIGSNSITLGEQYPATEPPVINQPLKSSITSEQSKIGEQSYTSLKTRLKAISEATGVSYDDMVAIIECESSFNPTAVGDNGHSYGLVQIYLDYHPTVTKEQALDPDFAMNFLADKLSKGEGHLWSCYHILSLKG